MNMFGLTFGAPLILGALLALPVIYYLLRLTPPKPRTEVFPPTRILAEMDPREETPAQSPWWLTLLRLLMAALVIVALSEPIWNAPDKRLTGDGPVLVLLDDGWTSGADWETRRTAAEEVIAEADAADRPVVLALASEGGLGDLAAGTADAALQRLGGAEPQPVPADYAALADKIADAGATSIVWVAPSVAPAGLDAVQAALADAAQLLIIRDANAAPVAVTGVANEPDALAVTLARGEATRDMAARVELLDLQGRSLASEAVALAAGDATSQARFALPVELRNEVARVVVADEQTAGAVHLLDERFRRRRVGLIAGGNADRDQPLLSPLYYIARALSPFAQVRESDTDNVLDAVDQFIDEKVSTLVLADIGTMPDETRERIAAWVDGGGMLVRFAGPRLAGVEDASDDLVPVELRRGGRSLGGTLTWGTPQPLASFDSDSPFAGLSVPVDVTVSRQVLAEPDAQLPDRTWASLADGTPLVTAAPTGEGWIVLFHTSADASWSNLALSGAFVDMLRRIVAVSNGSIASERARSDVAGETTGEPTDATVLPPLRVLDGRGRLTGPGTAVRPAAFPADGRAPATLETPPGLYGTSDAFVALNLFEAGDTLAPFDVAAMPSNARTVSLTTQDAVPFKPWLLAAALLLLALDCLAVLWMAGALRPPRRGVATAAALLALTIVPHDAFAQDETFDFKNALRTRLAYVETGVDELDRLSRKGLEGLTTFLATRTSLEPGAPVGVDIASDELAFFPLLYWPVSDDSPVPDASAMARVDAFMKRGGSVLFDTRDQIEGGFGEGVVTPATEKLREILGALDIPPLEPVPENHVLTRAFYLLDIFPGRYLEGSLWVETTEGEDDGDRPARAGDGVSSILITANDMAAAWAVEADGRPSLPVISNNPRQRAFAYRAGVNIVMYTLTGNYKSDQVHVPSLLERLGQ